MLLSVLLGADNPTVFRVPIQGTIDLGLPPFIERVITLAESDRPDLIVFDIDTFGGRIDGATRIKDAIMSAKVPTVAFINRRAISAGALISLACETIVMTKGATIGAATAVDLEGRKASEKVISYMREEMSATAEARGRSSQIAEGMVDEDIEIAYIILKGDTLTLDDVEGSHTDKLITLTTQKALRLGMADESYDDFNALLVGRGLAEATVIDFKPNWSEGFVRFITDPVVSSLLMTIGFLGLIFEVKTAGFGVGGIIGIIALTLFFGANFIAQLATITEVLIFLAGLTLLALEVVVIPGFGFAGIGGIILMLWGMFKMLLGEYPTPDQMERAFLALNIGIIGAIVGGLMLLRTLVTSKLFNKLAPISSENYSVATGLDALIGQSGTTITECMPTGKADVAGRQINVITQGLHIPKGATVKVISIEGNTAQIQVLEDS
ncbi:nodulation protein NfeD [Candidatus Neomarinimicrobiota bacterium]